MSHRASVRRQAYSQASKKNKRTNSKLSRYFELHVRAWVSSLGRLCHQPFASVLTCAVLAITLALPVSFLLLLNNAQSVLQIWDQGTQVSVYLQTGTAPSKARELMQQIKKLPNVMQAHYISPAEGMRFLSKQTGIQDLALLMPNASLPALIEVQPAQALATPLAMKEFITTLKQLPFVEEAQIDLQWLQRLNAIVQLVQKIVWVFTVLLAVGVLLIIGNTLRLTLEKYREEIKLLKLMGATHGFIRRPFLYTGLTYGFIGGFFASTLVSSFISGLKPLVAQLSLLYQSDFLLQGLTSWGFVKLLFFSMLLGLLAAWLSVSRAVYATKP